MKILWEPGSQVPRHYPTLPTTAPDLARSKTSVSVEGIAIVGNQPIAVDF